MVDDQNLNGQGNKVEKGRYWHVCVCIFTRQSRLEHNLGIVSEREDLY